VRTVAFHKQAWDDIQHWACTDKKLLARTLKLIEESRRDPSTGTGKPERLCGDMSGCWSRRIDDQHRLVYTIEDDQLMVLQARYHYGDH
jgi:toxin YoeB